MTVAKAQVHQPRGAVSRKVHLVGMKAEPFGAQPAGQANRPVRRP